MDNDKVSVPVIPTSAYSVIKPFSFTMSWEIISERWSKSSFLILSDPLSCLTRLEHSDNLVNRIFKLRRNINFVVYTGKWIILSGLTEAHGVAIDGNWFDHHSIGNPISVSLIQAKYNHCIIMIKAWLQLFGFPHHIFCFFFFFVSFSPFKKWPFRALPLRLFLTLPR